MGNIDISGKPGPDLREPELKASLDIDLARLAEKLPKTLRLRSDTKLLAGRLSLECQGQAGRDGALLWQGNVKTTELRGIRAGSNISWSDPLALLFRVRQAPGSLPSVEQLRCESAFMKLDADGSAEQFTLVASVDLPKLAEPLGQFLDLSQVAMQGKAGGQITVLHKEPDCFQVAGAGFLQAFHCELVKDRTWHEDSCTLAFHGEGRQLPRGGPRIDSGYVRIQSGQDVLDVQLVKPIANLTQGPWGSCAVQVGGDLGRWRGRLRTWTNALDDLPVAGTIAGRIAIQATAERLGFAGDLKVTDFMVGPTTKPKWREDEVRLEGQGEIDWRADVCRIDRVHIENPLASVDAKGNIDAVSGKKDYEFIGQVATKKLKAHGCDVGPADARVRLQAGWLQVAPLETTINGGRARLSANLRLVPEPMELRLSGGLVVDHAQITPEMCTGALGYAIPALAGATDVEGVVSLALEPGTLNLTDMSKSELRGTFTLHSARVGAGPMVRELSGLLQAPAQANLVKETQVAFQIIKGRVYHQNFELAFPNFTVRTSGSVGVDGTMAMIAEMPVPLRWLGNNPLRLSLAKQSIRLPIGGTIDHPRLDARALQAVSTQFLQNAAADALRQELDNNMKRLFGR
jgi:hypothetical protein